MYGIESFYGVASYTRVALHTSLLFILLGFGILFSRPEYGLMSIASSQTAGAVMIRRLIPFAIIIPVSVGYIRIIGQSKGLYGTEFGTAIFAILSTSILCLVIFLNAINLHRLDIERIKTQVYMDRFYLTSLNLLCTGGFDGYFKELNDVWEKTLGYTKKELMSRTFFEFIHPEDRERTKVEMEKLIKGDKTFSFENRYLAKDGSVKWFLWNATPITEEQIVYATAMDITEKKQQEEKLKETVNELEKLNRIMFGREEKILELKEEIKKLKGKTNENNK